MSNFGTILDRPSSEVERPKPLPAGTYACVVSGLPKYDKSSKKQTEFVEFQLQPVAAGEDVDEEALRAWMTKKDGSTRALNETRIRATYYLTEDSVWRLKDFLNHCGAGDDNTMSLRQRIESTPNCEVIAFVKHRSSDDGESTFAELAKTATMTQG